MKSYRRKDIIEARAKWHNVIEIAANAAEGIMPMISEMVIPLKTFIERIEGLKFEIVENWCLCKWCQLYSPHHETFNHWKEELEACLKALHNTNIKNKIGKKRHLDKVFAKESDFNDIETVIYAVKGKFNKEGIHDIHQISAVAKLFANSIDKLIDAISNKNIDIEAYISGNFA